MDLPACHTVRTGDKRPPPTASSLSPLASLAERLNGRDWEGNKGKERGGRREAISVLQKRMIQIECGTNLNPEMTDVFSMALY